MGFKSLTMSVLIICYLILIMYPKLDTPPKLKIAMYIAVFQSGHGENRQLQCLDRRIVGFKSITMSVLIIC